jgi:serine/threonine protein kinase
MSLVEHIWKSFQSFGVKDTGRTLQSIRSWLRRAPLLYKPSILKHKGEHYIRSPTVRYSSFTLFMRGSYGAVYQAIRETDRTIEVVFVKHSPTHESNLVVEGFLQHIAHIVLDRFGCPTAVPKVLDIVSHPTLATCLILQRIPGSQLFSDYLNDRIQWGSPSRSNDLLVFDVLAQVASYCAILEKEIGMNHRDLKGTNVLMVAPGLSEKTLAIPGAKWILHRKSEAILIDFGFACMGEEGTPTVSAGELLSTGDFCPKEGRDIFVLLGSLWNVPSLRDSLSPSACRLFKRWLRTHDSDVSWADWLISAAVENLNALYLLTSANQFRAPSCAPLQLIRDISEEYPELITVEGEAQQDTDS